MRIAIYGRQFNDPVVFPYIQQVFDNLINHGVEIYLHRQLHDFLDDNIKTIKYKVLENTDDLK